MPPHNDVRVSGGGVGGGKSSGGGSWGRKDHPHGSLCNNDSNVNDGAATSINSGLLQEPQRRPAGGFTLQSADLGHVGVSQPGIRIRGGRETNNNTLVVDGVTRSEGTSDLAPDRFPSSSSKNQTQPAAVKFGALAESC